MEYATAKDKLLGGVSSKELHLWKSWSAGNFLEDDPLKMCLI